MLFAKCYSAEVGTVAYGATLKDGSLIRVCHVIVGLDIGGAETLLNRLIESNPASISETVVVSLTSLGAIGDALSSQGGIPPIL